MVHRGTRVMEFANVNTSAEARRSAQVQHQLQRLARGGNYHRYAMQQWLIDERERRARILLNYTRPPLADIVRGSSTMLGPTQFLIDFAIVGFGKCGTSTLLFWLAQHSHIQTFHEELWDLVQQQPANLIRHYYNRLNIGHYQRGHKCPGEIVLPYVLDYYRKYWPRTKLIIGVRHPVRWFESLYNFRIQNLLPQEWLQGDFPHPNQLIGRCMGGMKHTCTERGNFAYHLIRLGKQHWNTSANLQLQRGPDGSMPPPPREATALEETIVGYYRKDRYSFTDDVKYLPNPVFLFDVTQFSDTNATRQAQFRRDIQEFLNVPPQLGPLLHYKPGRQWVASEQAQRDARKIDICHAEFAPVRQELLRLSRQNAEWLASVFLQLPDVHVSSRDYVIHDILERWRHDPCDETKKQDDDDDDHDEPTRPETT